jgi:hypothetical protein
MADEVDHSTDSGPLIRHTLHLCNVLLSQFGAWLSLEALHRDSAATGIAVPIDHAPLMLAQASMMVSSYACQQAREDCMLTFMQADAFRNLDAAVGALTRTQEHTDMLKEQSYRSLLDAAYALSRTIGMFLPNFVQGQPLTPDRRR